MLNCQIATLSDGTIGFDTATPLNHVTAAQYASKGFSFVVRYVGRNDGSHHSHELTSEEAQLILDAGLGLGVAQHPLANGWYPTADLGQRFGEAAAALAGTIGIPAGAHLWLVLDGVQQGANPWDIIAYCMQWHNEVASVGYSTGIYVGAQPGLTGNQLYWDLPFSSYWRGGSKPEAGVPADLPFRGWQMQQRIDNHRHNHFDFNVVHSDKFGDNVFWCVPDEEEVDVEVAVIE